MTWRSLRLLTGIFPPLAEIPWILAGLGEMVGPSTVLEGLAMGGTAWRPDPISNSIVTKAIHFAAFHLSAHRLLPLLGPLEASLDLHRQQLLPRLLPPIVAFSLPPMGLAPLDSSRRSWIPLHFPRVKSSQTVATGVYPERETGAYGPIKRLMDH